MALLVTGDDIKVEINHDGVNDNFFAIGIHDSACASATEIFRVEDQGDVLFYGALLREADPIVINRTSGAGDIAQFGPVSGGTFSDVGRISGEGRADFDDGVVLPVLSASQTSAGTEGDVVLVDALSGGVHRYALQFKENNTVPWKSITLS